MNFQLLAFAAIACVGNSRHNSIHCGGFRIHNRFSGVSMCTQSANNKLIVLGSGSSSRKSILLNAGYSFEIVKPDLDEKAIGDRTVGTMENAKKLVVQLGISKAENIMLKISPEIKRRANVLLTADQVVVRNDKILEKPVDVKEARKFISMAHLHSCSTVGSIVLTEISTGRRVYGVDVATIAFNPIPDDIIDKLIEEGEVMYCAGALMIENPIIQPYISRIDGKLDSVMGLSTQLLGELSDELRKRDT